MIGSGFSGICMGIKLKQAGIHNFVILERAAEVGGTWRDNDYPGCACDVPSHLYSFSFEPNPNWSQMFPLQAEIKQYLERCVEKYALREHVRLNCNVSEARYCEDSGTWHTSIDSGDRFESKILVSGMGGLSRPGFANIPGIEQFEGPIFHSAQWQHDVELSGLRVAVVGTGASAIQFVPQIVDRVASLRLFQRTPPWVVPKHDRKFRGWEKWCFKHIPFARFLWRNLIYWGLELRGIGFTISPKLMAPAKKIALKHIRSSISDESLQRRVTPDYTIGCKRILISNDYYPALQRENLELVTNPVDRITPSGIVDVEGQAYEVDAIIFATGFNAIDPLSPMQIYGRDDRKLSQDWRDGPEAYLGITVSGYPNLFLLMGPNTGLGHNSMVFMIESQVGYSVSLIKRIVSGQQKRIEVDASSQEAYNRRIQEDLRKTVWTSGCNSWYQTSAGHHSVLWPGFTFTYWAKTKRPKLSHYRRN